MHTLLRSLLLMATSVLVPWAGAQTLSWNFDGPNGLLGWSRSDGGPMITEPGLASSTCVRLNTGGNDPGELFYYHEIPFDPTLGYHLTWWTTIATSGLLPDARLFVSWVDEQFGSVQLLDANLFHSSSYSLQSWSGNGTGRGPITPNDYSGDPNARFCVVLFTGSTNPTSLWVDNVTVNIGAFDAAHLHVRGLLGGAMDGLGATMRDDLRAQGLVPAQEPYTLLGYPQVAGGGAETAFPESFFEQTVGYSIVDWVRIELRSALDPTVVVATKQGLVNMPGFVGAASGEQMLVFDVPSGDYYVVLRHRNHLGCMTATPVTIGTWLSAGFVDFRTTATTWGTDAQDTSGALATLWPGNTNGDATIKYTGMNNDRDPVLIAVGGGTPLNVLTNLYDANDTNLDADVKYVGIDNDRDVILTTLNGVVLGTRTEQVP